MPHARERLNILGRTWRVHFVKSPLKYEGVKCDGLTYPDKHLIQISLHLSRDRMRSKLLHEAIHAVIDATTGDHRADEEACVTSLESGLYPLLRDNPWLVAFLTEEDK